MRLLLSVSCALLALPILLTFDSMLMWKVTLGATEYGHRIALAPLLLAAWSWRRRAWTGVLFNTVTALVLLSPLITAAFMARTLPAELERAFGGKMPSTVLSWPDMFLGRAPAQQAPLLLTVPGSEPAAVTRRIHFHRADSASPAPCIIYLHGGGWHSGSALEFAEWSTHWTTQGYAVASIEYRLAPQWQWPAPLEDVRDSLAFLKTHAAEHGIDAQKLILMGRSAGGQIATAAAYSLNDPAILGCISIYSPGDMIFARRFAAPDDVLDSTKLLRQYLGDDPAQAGANYLSASGTLLAHPHSPPTLIIHGQRDILVWHLQSHRLAEALQQQRVPHYFLDLPWATHGLDFPFHGPGAQLSRYAMEQFLRRLTQG